MTDQTATHQNALVLAQLEAVKIQLTSMTAMMQQQFTASNQRIDDLRHSIETRIDGHEARIGTLETNERSTAIKAAGVSALTSAIVAGCIAMLKAWPR